MNLTDHTDGPEPGKCGAWMKRAQTWCARKPHATGRHRTPQGVANDHLAHDAYTTAFRKMRYDWLNAYKLERGCIDCGYRKDPRALDFDHRDPSLKVANISVLVRVASWENLLAEIEKCDVRCACCHRIKTHTPWE